MEAAAVFFAAVAAFLALSKWCGVSKSSVWVPVHRTGPMVPFGARPLACSGVAGSGQPVKAPAGISRVPQYQF